MEQQRFECTVGNCHKTYSNAFNLKRHVESFHEGLKKFFCPLCNKGLSSKQNMREHKFIHMGIKPYKCSFKDCNSQFRQASHLFMHEKLHIEIYKSINTKSSVFRQNLSFLTALLSKAVENTYVQVEEVQRYTQDIVLPQIKFKKPLNESDKYCADGNSVIYNN